MIDILIIFILCCAVFLYFNEQRPENGLSQQTTQNAIRRREESTCQYGTSQISVHIDNITSDPYIPTSPPTGKKSINDIASDTDTDYIPKKQFQIPININIAPPCWDTPDLLYKTNSISLNLAQKLVKLFRLNFTIPFIARHRKDLIGTMTTEKLRGIRNSYESLEALKEDIVKVHKKLLKVGLLNEELYFALRNATSREMLEGIYEPYKKVIDGKNATRLLALSHLEKIANRILFGGGHSMKIDQASSVLIDIMASKMTTCQPAQDYLQSVYNNALPNLFCKKRTVQEDSNINPELYEKFDKYCNGPFKTNDLKDYQVLAINRGEKLNILNVHIEFESFFQSYCNIIRNDFPKAAEGPKADWFNQALQISYSKKAVPMLHRMKRAALSNRAKQSALEVYANNLKECLQTPPIRNRRILGVDPGKSLGCKLALISETGDVLATQVVHPHSANEKSKANAKKAIRKMIIDHECTLIALGNGTGCRKAEAWITNMITENYFHPLQVTYRIVIESGSSIYSCSPGAIEEFGDMNPNLISAVSLARRLQDPLSELVKFEPRHMGIGMYQHDVDIKELEEKLKDVVIECVSFMGVDINTASKHLLKYVAGLSETLAEKIVTYRKENGNFEGRECLLQVPGISEDIYRQCVGFLRIYNGANKLDETGIHPNNYNIVNDVLTIINMTVNNLGTKTFRQKLHQLRPSILKFFKPLKTHKASLEATLDELAFKRRTKDIAKKISYRSDVRKLADLEMGTVLTGAVVNVTTFGVFIDVGMETDGFHPLAKGAHLRIGDIVEVKVTNFDFKKRQIRLDLLQT